MLADNILVLKKKYPRIYNLIRNAEERQATPNFFLEKSKHGLNTLRYDDGQLVLYLHSKYNPEQEAQKIIDDLCDSQTITDNSHVVFFGMGLGYHIAAFNRMFPNTVFSIIEPSVEVMSKFLNTTKLESLNIKRLKLLQVGSGSEELFNTAISNKAKDLIICELPVYTRLFNNDYAEFLKEFKTVIKQKHMSFRINYAFKKRWVINSINNLKSVLVTPNIFSEHQDQFKGKTAILVAAGPSLDAELEHLKKVKEEGLAYIFAAGTSINTLIYHNIMPDAICTYDPTEANQKVFYNINELGIKTVPLIFGTSVGYEVLEQYKGPKYHMITTQDPVADYFLRKKNKSTIEYINDSSSIAVVTYELLVKLGFTRIVLVGQNLGYVERKIYASGVTHRSSDLENVETILVEDVNGDQIETSQSLLEMKRMLEVVIEKYGIETNNTTVKGAKIKGAEFVSFEKIIESVLINRQVDKQAFNEIEQVEVYDQIYLKEKLKLLNKKHTEYQELLFKSQATIEKAENTMDLNRFKILQNELDRLIKAIEKNDYFKFIASPLNRVEYSIAAEYYSKSSHDQASLFKRKANLKHVKVFIMQLISEIDLNNNIILVLNNIIDRYLKEGQ